jgi:hypothetical protein
MGLGFEIARAGLVSIPTVMARSKSASASVHRHASAPALGDAIATHAVSFGGSLVDGQSLRLASVESETVTDVAVELSALRISHHRRGCVKVSGRAVVPEGSRLHNHRHSATHSDQNQACGSAL